MSRHRDVMADNFAVDDADDLETGDPMSGLSNLADCMLVLACGLMITLVVHWNLNVAPHYEVVQETGNLVDVEGNPELAVASNDPAQAAGENVYENMGVLYRDTDTGKLYYLREWDEEE